MRKKKREERKERKINISREDKTGKRKRYTKNRSRRKRDRPIFHEPNILSTHFLLFPKARHVPQALTETCLDE